MITFSPRGQLTKNNTGAQCVLDHWNRTTSNICLVVDLLWSKSIQIWRWIRTIRWKRNSPRSEWITGWVGSIFSNWPAYSHFLTYDNNGNSKSLITPPGVYTGIIYNLNLISIGYSPINNLVLIKNGQYLISTIPDKQERKWWITHSCSCLPFKLVQETGNYFHIKQQQCIQTLPLIEKSG